jgi:hypothetical protein
VAGRDDLIDKGGPVVRPLLLQNGYEDEIKLVEKCLLRSKGFFAARALDDELNDEIPNT